MQTLVLVLHILAAIGIVVLVLLQHGKGADMGAAFGSGSAGSLFGSAGAANFLSRSTAVLAAVFFATVFFAVVAFFAAVRRVAINSPGSRTARDRADMRSSILGPRSRAQDAGKPSQLAGRRKGVASVTP